MTMAPSTTTIAAGDHQLVPSLIPIQLTSGNYPLWRSSFISVLKASNMLDLTEDGVPCPPQSETLAYADWIKRDQVLLTWINSALSVGLLARTKGFTSGRALWFYLENHLIDVSMIYVQGLRDRLANLKYYKVFPPAPKDYIVQAKLIADALEMAGSPVDDSELVYFVLNGLPDSYGGFVAGIRNRSPPVTLDQLGYLFQVYIPREIKCFIIMFLAWIIGFCFAAGNVIPDNKFIVYTIVNFVVAVGIWVTMIVSDVIRSRRSPKMYEKPSPSTHQ